VADDCIGFAQNSKSFLSNLSDNSNREAGTWEWLTENNGLRKAELYANLSNLIFEKESKRLD
jgi:hypothetical protein